MPGHSKVETDVLLGTGACRQPRRAADDRRPRGALVLAMGVALREENEPLDPSSTSTRCAAIDTMRRPATLAFALPLVCSSSAMQTDPAPTGGSQG